MKPPTRRFLLSFAGGAAYLALLVGAAWLGVASARRSLPATLSGTGGYPAGVTVVLRASGEPIFLGEEVQGLRDFFFAHQNLEARRDGDAEARGLRRIFEPLEVKTLGRDADAVNIEIVTGPLTGVRGWVHLSQMPPPPAPPGKSDAR